MLSRLKLDRRVNVADVSDIVCPIERALTVIRDKWTTLILRDLMLGSSRFNELKRSLGKITSKTLTERLVQMEKDGLVGKKAYLEVPIRVEYSLREKGRDMKLVLDALHEWGEKWIPRDPEKTSFDRMIVTALAKHGRKQTFGMR